MATRQRQRAALTLNRTIEIETLTTVRGRFGGEREEWTPLPGGAMWANARDMKNPQEVFRQDASREVATRYLTFRIHWRNDFDERARIRYEGSLFDIRGIAEIGRRQHLDIITSSAP